MGEERKGAQWPMTYNFFILYKRAGRVHITTPAGTELILQPLITSTTDYGEKCPPPLLLAAKRVAGSKRAPAPAPALLAPPVPHVATGQKRTRTPKPNPVGSVAPKIK